MFNTESTTASPFGAQMGMRSEKEIQNQREWQAQENRNRTQREKSEAEQAAYEVQLKTYCRDQHSLRVYQSYLDEARAEVQKYEAQVYAVQARIEEMLSKGFVPPATPAPKPAVEAPKVVAVKPKPAPSVPSTPAEPALIPCPICGDVRVKSTQAFHKIGESEICVIDLARTRQSGVFSGIIERAMERQGITQAVPTETKHIAKKRK